MKHLDSNAAKEAEEEIPDSDLDVEDLTEIDDPLHDQSLLDALFYKNTAKKVPLST